jgi:prepilin-type N-terminal cleavage/methylation domain-containing protein
MACYPAGEPEPTAAPMRFGDRKAFTLIEMMVVVAIIGIISAVGYTQVSNLLPRYRAYQAAREFATDVQLLRNLSATEGVEHRLALVSYDAAYDTYGTPNEGMYYRQAGNRAAESTRWELLPIDALEDGVDEQIGEGTVDLATTRDDVSIAPWDTISGPSYGGSPNEDCIVISPRGWLVNPNGDFDENGHIVVRFVNKEALRRDVYEEYQVKISRTGMVRVDFNDQLYANVLGNSQGVDEASSANSASSSGS